MDESKNQSEFSRNRRSSEARKRRNKARKEKLKKQKKAQFDGEQERKVEMEQKIMKLERINRFLKKSSLSTKPIQYRSIHSCSVAYTASVMKMHQNKKYSLIQKLKHKTPVFKRNDVTLCKELGSGVYGTVNAGLIKSMVQIVAVKILSANSNRTDIMAEAAVLREMSGDPRFPYFFGIMEPNLLLMEFIGNESKSPALRDIIRNELHFPDWSLVCIDLVRGLHELHTRGILHNDLHPGNVLIRDLKYVKIIDFGKATLINDPVVYSLKPGSNKQKRFNTYHRHLAHELRNILGSKATCKSDIYSLGYNFDKVSTHVKSVNLGTIAFKMLSASPTDRPKLSDILIQLSRI